MAGFEWKYNVGGGEPLILSIFAKNTETLTKGDIGQADTGEVDLAVTSDASLIGEIVGASDPADEKSSGVITAVNSTTKIKVIASPDAVYEVTDANARNMGDTLDISRATGAQGVAASANTEFVVVETSLSTEKTRVMIVGDSHYLAKAL